MIGSTSLVWSRLSVASSFFLDAASLFGVCVQAVTFLGVFFVEHLEQVLVHQFVLQCP